MTYKSRKKLKNKRAKTAKAFHYGTSELKNDLSYRNHVFHCEISPKESSQWNKKVHGGIFEIFKMRQVIDFLRMSIPQWNDLKRECFTMEQKMI